MKYVFAFIIGFAVAFLLIPATPSDQRTSPPAGSSDVFIDCDAKGCCPQPSAEADEVTGRYHLRGRTKRFFGRVA